MGLVRRFRLKEAIFRPLSSLPPPSFPPLQLHVISSSALAPPPGAFRPHLLRGSSGRPKWPKNKLEEESRDSDPINIPAKAWTIGFITGNGGNFDNFIENLYISTLHYPKHSHAVK